MRIHDDPSSLTAGCVPPAEWAAQLQRFPALRSADRLLVAGALGVERVERMAEQLASFHAEARSDAATAAVGAPDMLERRVEEVAVQARAMASEADMLDETTQWLRAFARGHGWLFAARASSGRVREGHGALRLSHVWFDTERRRATIARASGQGPGCIADTCSDVADLANDLAVEGRPDLAERFLAQYLAESDDYRLLAVFPFYTALRAVERCVGDHDRDPHAWLEMRTLVERARRASQPVTPVPALVVVGGSVSDLRSSVAEAAASTLKAPRIRIERLLHAVGRDPRGTAALEARSRPPASVMDIYDAALRRAEMVMESGRSCVLEGGFRSTEMRTAAREVAERGNGAFRFVDCRQSASVRTPVNPLWPQPFMSVPAGTTELSEHERIVLGADVPLDRALCELRAAMRPWKTAGVGS